MVYFISKANLEQQLKFLEFLDGSNELQYDKETKPKDDLELDRDDDSVDFNAGTMRIQEQPTPVNPFKAAGPGGSALLNILKQSISSMHLSFKQSKKKGQAYSASGATGAQDFNLRLNTLSSDGEDN